jgi:hypothetical protein
VAPQACFAGSPLISQVFSFVKKVKIVSAIISAKTIFTSCATAPGRYSPDTRAFFSSFIRVVFEILPERKGSALCRPHIVDSTSPVPLVKKETKEAAPHLHLFYAESSSDSHEIATDKTVSIFSQTSRNVGYLLLTHPDISGFPRATVAGTIFTGRGIKTENKSFLYHHIHCIAGFANRPANPILP